MKNLTIATAAAAGFAAAVLGLAAPAVAAPSAGNATDTISQLEADGNRVVVNRLSDAPLSQASVVSVQPGADLRGTTWDADHDTTYQNSIIGKVYYVDVR